MSGNTQAQTEDKLTIVRFLQSVSPFSVGELAGIDPRHAQAYASQGFVEIVGPPKRRDRSGDWINKNGPVQNAVNVAELLAQIETLTERLVKLEAKGKKD